MKIVKVGNENGLLFSNDEEAELKSSLPETIQILIKLWKKDKSEQKRELIEGLTVLNNMFFLMD